MSETEKHIEYQSNGKKRLEGTYKDGKRDGLWTRWHENGQMKVKGTFKDGEQDGLWTWWDKNGQKSFEGTYKDGQEDGLLTWWHNNGQKWKEKTYKDGEEISAKCWDADGNECECSEYGGCKQISDIKHQAPHSWGFLFVQMMGKFE